MGWVGGWVFSHDIALVNCVCIIAFWKLGLLEKQIAGLQFSVGNFQYLEFAVVAKFSDFSDCCVSVKPLDFSYCNVVVFGID